MAKRRKAGEGTLRLRKDGRWEGRVVVEYDEKGRPKTKSVLAHTKEECLEKLEALRARCGIVTGKARPGMPFGEWMDLWYKTYSKPGLRITTQKSYENRIYRHIIPGLGRYPWTRCGRAICSNSTPNSKSPGASRGRTYTGRGFPTAWSAPATPPATRHWKRP